MKPLISVVVPAYNVAEYLSACLDSLLAQTYNHLEIIVVNDGSSDGTASVMDMYAEKDPRIKVIHKENGGVTSARFCGINQATGEWIGFVDGDDAVDPDMYERLLANAVKYDAQISHCGHRIINEDGEEHCFYNTGNVVQQDTSTGMRDLLEGSFIEPGLWNKLFHKSLFHGLLHGDEMDFTIRNNEDLLMNVILFKQAKQSVYEDFCPYQYFVRQGSASRRPPNEHTVFDPIIVKERILSIVSDPLQNDAQKAYAMTCINVYNSLLLFSGKEICEMRSKVREKLTEHFGRTVFLNRKYRMMANLIRYMPWLYRGVYGVYALLLRKD